MKTDWQGAKLNRARNAAEEAVILIEALNTLVICKEDAKEYLNKAQYYLILSKQFLDKIEKEIWMEMKDEIEHGRT